MQPMASLDVASLNKERTKAYPPSREDSRMEPTSASRGNAEAERPPVTTRSPWKPVPIKTPPRRPRATDAIGAAPRSPNTSPTVLACQGVAGGALVAADTGGPEGAGIVIVVRPPPQKMAVTVAPRRTPSNTPILKWRLHNSPRAARFRLNHSSQSAESAAPPFFLRARPVSGVARTAAASFAERAPSTASSFRASPPPRGSSFAAATAAPPRAYARLPPFSPPPPLFAARRRPGSCAPLCPSSPSPPTRLLRRSTRTRRPC